MTLFRPQAAPDDLARAHITVGATLPVWSLADLYASPDDPAIEADLTGIDAASRAFQASTRTQLASFTPAQLNDAIATYESITESLARLTAYAQLHFSADATLAAAGRFHNAIIERTTAIGADILFFRRELAEIDGSNLAPSRYAPWLRDLRAERPHMLAEPLERLLHDKSLTGHAWTRLFDETIATLRIDLDDTALTLHEAIDRLSDPARTIREHAARAIGQTLDQNARLFTLITNTLAKDKAIEDEWRHNPTPDAARHRANRIEPAIVTALTTAVTAAYPRLAHRYFTLKARWLGLDRLQHYDRNAPLPGFGGADPLIRWSTACSHILTAYHAFDPALAAIAARFFDQPWIDAVPRSGKSGGAFAHPTVPAVHPYILLSYQGRPRDVMTLAHEIGHAIHQTLAAEQGYLMAQTPLTLAETAAMFGETLVFRALLEAQPDQASRRLLIAHKVEDSLNTITRQIAFHHFEQRLHAQRRHGELTTAAIGAVWLETQRDSLGPAFTLSDDYRIFWATIPHFIHAPFYVYAYPFGACLANSLHAVYQDAIGTGTTQNFTETYASLLRAGGTTPHDELLAPFGLDPADPTFWQRGLDVIACLIDQLEE